MINPNPASAKSFDRYAYAYNNPLNYTDPSGHLPTGESDDEICLPGSYCNEDAEPWDGGNGGTGNGGNTDEGLEEELKNHHEDIYEQISYDFDWGCTAYASSVLRDIFGYEEDDYWHYGSPAFVNTALFREFLIESRNATALTIMDDMYGRTISESNQLNEFLANNEVPVGTLIFVQENWEWVENPEWTHVMVVSGYEIDESTGVNVPQIRDHSIDRGPIERSLFDVGSKKFFRLQFIIPGGLP